METPSDTETTGSECNVRSSDLLGDAIQAGNSVLMEEQAMLLRECRAAIDSLIEQRPGIQTLVCGSTTLGNLRAELYDYRPKGIFGLCDYADRVRKLRAALKDIDNDDCPSGCRVHAHAALEHDDRQFRTESPNAGIQLRLRRRLFLRKQKWVASQTSAAMTC